MNDTPSVVVTGCSGTIGTALTERLIAEGVLVVGVDRRPNRWSETVDERTVLVDLLDSNASESLPSDVDLIIHLAARSRVGELLEEPSLAEENIRTTSTVLEHARRVDADLVFASSREVYGDQSLPLYDESNDGIRAAINPYGASKAGCEALIASYDRCFDVRTATLRLSNVYGRYDVANRVVPMFIAQAARSEDLTVYGEDKLLDFLYIDDCIDAILSAIDQLGTVRGETVNVGSGRGRTVLELAEMVVDRVDNRSDVSVEPTRTGEVDRFVADVRLAQSLLGFEPEYTLSEGLDSTVDWYLDRTELLDEIV